MAQLRRPQRPPRSTLVIALLLLTLVLVAVLAYQAAMAAHSHRATAERALRDYAAVAAWDYSLNVKDRLWAVLTEAFYPVKKADLSAGGGPLPPPEIIAATVSEVAACETAAEDSARYYFRLDLRDGSLATSGAPVSPALRTWIADTLGAHARAVYGTDWIYAQILGEAEGRHRTLAYTLKRDATGEPVAAYGFESCLTTWGTSIFGKTMLHALLPPALMGDLPNDSLFSITVTDTVGRVLYRSARQYPETFSATATLGGSQGGLITRVSLSPTAAGRLVIGGLPRSRLPMLLGLLALTVGLIGVALLQLRRESELARLRSGFISSVSHELRTPLAQIRMFAETLLLGRVRSEEERRRSLEIIDQEARRLTHLVGNVLQFSRAERRLTHLTLEVREVAAEVRETLEVFGPLAQARRVELRRELQEGVVAPVDRSALRQVLLNLLDNALKYGPAGQRVTVGQRLHGDRVRIWVDDEGPGIAPRDRQRIWEPFYRRECDVNSAVAGSGIGLAVVAELVSQHGGRVWTEDAPSGGARFVIELPGASLRTGDPDRPPAQPAAIPLPATVATEVERTVS